MPWQILESVLGKKRFKPIINLIRKTLHKTRQLIFPKGKHLIVKLTRICLFLLMFIWVFADFLANDKPIIASQNGKIIFPVVHSIFVQVGIADWSREYVNADWKSLEYGFSIWPPIPYGRSGQDELNISKGPFDSQQTETVFGRHWLGTDDIGRDIASAMVHATRIDLTIGIAAMLIAAFIGIILGSLAGFFGDDQLKIGRGRLYFNFILLAISWFYAVQIRYFDIVDAFQSSWAATLGQALISLGLFLLIMLIGNIIALIFDKIPFLGKKVRFPVDNYISRGIEILVSIPVLFLIIMLLAMTNGGSIFWLIIIIGLTRWTGIARLMRAELLKIRKLDYIESARSLGYTSMRIIFRHAVPNALSPVIIAISFGVAGSILIEAFLSFIGIGVPPDIPTWGSILNDGRQNPSDWWLAVFPGLAIFITVTAFNLLGDQLNRFNESAKSPKT